MKRYSHLSLSLLLSIIILILSIVPVSASSITSFTTDTTTGWEKSTENPHHMGTKSTTYKFASDVIKNKYAVYVTNGFALWGTAVNCNYSATSTKGIITVEPTNPYGFAASALQTGASSGHVTTWRITIYTDIFDNNSTAKKYRTMAHELGHVYGLGHVGDYTKIMYNGTTETKNVTAKDKNGMNVMTHTHTHSGSYSKSYVNNGYNHTARCSTCLAAVVTESCTYTDYHSNNRHYFVYNCACGKNKTESYACTGNPCIIQPYSIDPEYEVA